MWSQSGTTLNFIEIAAEARKAKPFAAVINPDDPSFATPGDMPARIRAFCRKTGQKLPAGEGQMARVTSQTGGSVEVVARVTSRVPEGVVFLPGFSAAAPVSRLLAGPGSAVAAVKVERAS